MKIDDYFSKEPKVKHYEIINTRKQLLKLRNTMMTLDELACFDGSTELLTENGWMRLDKYVELDEYPKVLSYGDGALKFKPVKKVIKKKYEGDMVRFRNKSLDMFMTPNHKVILFNNGDVVKTDARDLKLSNDLHIKVAGCRPFGYKHLTNIDRLLIALSADGHYVSKDDVYTLSFTKQRKVDRLKYILDGLGINYTSGSHQRTHRKLPDQWFRVKLPKYIRFKKGLHNIVSLKDVSTTFAREFIEEVSLWDGSTHKDRVGSLSYNTSIEEEADFYSAMCVIGNSLNHHTTTTNSSGVLKTGCNLNKSSVTLTGSKELIPYSGYVYCVQVPDTSCFFARRNKGTPFLTHNCDTETNSLRANGPNKEFQCVGISISWGEYNNYYIPINHLREEDIYNNADLEDVVYALTPVFEREDLRLIAHNYHFDAHVFDRIGIRIKTKDIFDTLIASFLIDENEDNKLKNNTQRYLGINQTHFKDVLTTVPKEVKKAHGLKANSRTPFSLTLIEDGAPYALDDAFYTWELYLGFENWLKDEGMHKIYYKHYVPFIDCMLTVERNGVTIDIEKLEKMREEINIDCEDLKFRMLEIAGVEFNPNSNQHKAELLFGYVKPDKPDKNGVMKKANINQHIIDANFGFKPISKTKAGAPSTDSDTFWELALTKNAKGRKAEGVEFCKLMSEYSKLEKLRSAFIEGTLENLYDDGKIHCNYNLTGATSGRVSASAINLMQLPKAEDEDKYQIRALFIGDTLKDGNREKIVAFDLIA